MLLERSFTGKAYDAALDDEFSARSARRRAREHASSSAASLLKPLSTVVSANSSAVFAQNYLGTILDAVESLKNALAWTHPAKTCALFALLSAFALLFWRVKTRWLVLAVGLYEFSYRLLPLKGSPMQRRFTNLLRSVPNDDELRRCYEQRAAAHARNALRLERRRRRRARLHAIWDSRWAGRCVLRVQSAHDRAAHSPTSHKAYLVLHGRRLLCWHSEQECDSGRQQHGALLLQGHSGLTDPSPTDLAAAKDKAENLLAVFGQASDGAPLRWSIQVDDQDDKRRLADAIHAFSHNRLD